MAFIEKEIKVVLKVADFGQWLAVKRMGLRLSQEQIAGALGVTRQSVSQWENGNATPRINSDQARDLCQLLDCSIEELPTKGVKLIQIIRAESRRVVKSKG